MAGVDDLYRAYIEEHRAGRDADPHEYLAKLDGAERIELAALIDGYLARAPGREWDAAEFSGSGAERVAAEIASEWEVEDEDAVGWRELLPTLRSRARLLRRDLVERLAEALGVPEGVDKVGAYYHRMETGELPPPGVSDRVLDALGEILGVSGEEIRSAGRVSGGTATQGELRAELYFARTAQPDPRFSDVAASDAPGAAGQASASGADRVDELFTGGPDAGG